MADALTSNRLQLPLLAAGQAQNEITHNEAVTLIDALLFPVAEAAAQNAPPIAPVPGQCWLIGPSPTGAWAGMAHAMAVWTSAGWRFAPLPTGAKVAVGSSRTWWSKTAAGWQIAASVGEPAGGATIDAECRASFSQLVQALRATGIIANS